MTDPIFALPRHDYASYQDLYRLIALSGFPICFMDEIDAASDNTYILTIYNGEVTGWPGARARICLYDLEWHLDGVPLIEGVRELWAGDKWYAERIGAKYVPMGSHPELRPAMTSKQDLYDVAFIGYINGVHRRSALRQQLIERGVKVSPTGAWGDERHTLLRNSAAYLCVHQHDNAPTIAPLRMVVAAAYGLPVITEMCADYGIWSSPPGFETIYSIPYNDIADQLVNRFFQPWYVNQLLETGGRLHQFLCHDFTFRKSIEAAL